VVSHIIGFVSDFCMCLPPTSCSDELKLLNVYSHANHILCKL